MKCESVNVMCLNQQCLNPFLVEKCWVALCNRRGEGQAMWPGNRKAGETRENLRPRSHRSLFKEAWQSFSTNHSAEKASYFYAVLHCLLQATRNLPKLQLAPPIVRSIGPKGSFLVGLTSLLDAIWLCKSHNCIQWETWLAMGWYPQCNPHCRRCTPDNEVDLSSDNEVSKDLLSEDVGI
jgi:hypothetical protein